MKHTFILDNCLSHPSSPVNLLSTRQLAEKIIDSDGNPDEQTRIESRYSTHVLTWSFGNFKKIFPTPISGLPELLFDEGFRQYNSFCMQVSSFTTTDKIQRSNSNIIPFDDDEVQPIQALDNEEETNMLFMLNQTILFKDGKGITPKVTYLGPESSGGILKHKIRTCNDTKFLVDDILLSYLDVPDISTVPISVEQYAADIPKLTRQQLEQIYNPQTLDNAQCEFMELHYKMNHLPLPALITLAEKGKINKKFIKLKSSLTNMHVMHFWPSPLLTMAIQGFSWINS
jgi:hypothetical protein